MLTRVALSILVPVFSYIFGYNIISIVGGVSSIFSSVYVVFKSKSERTASFQIMTVILLLSSIILGKFKGIGHPGALYLSIALFFVPLLDYPKPGLKRALITSPFWFFIALAVGEIFSVRYGRFGYLLSLVVVPIVWRDSRFGKVQKAERVSQD